MASVGEEAKGGLLEALASQRRKSLSTVLVISHFFFSRVALEKGGQCC